MIPCAPSPQLVVGGLPGIGGTRLIDDHEVTRIAPPQDKPIQPEGLGPQGKGYLSQPQTGVAQ